MDARYSAWGATSNGAPWSPWAIRLSWVAIQVETIETQAAGELVESTTQASF
jgi:hypothetical protein